MPVPDRFPGDRSRPERSLSNFLWVNVMVLVTLYLPDITLVLQDPQTPARGTVALTTLLSALPAA
jgi:hypothetical protein